MRPGGAGGVPYAHGVWEAVILSFSQQEISPSFAFGEVLSFPKERGVPRPGAGHFLYLPPAASFLSAAKEKRKRNAAKNYVFGFPCAASHGFYLVKISHANVVPRKFHLNVELSLLLFSLPFLL